MSKLDYRPMETKLKKELRKVNITAEELKNMSFEKPHYDENLFNIKQRKIFKKMMKIRVPLVKELIKLSELSKYKSKNKMEKQISLYNKNAESVNNLAKFLGVYENFKIENINYDVLVTNKTQLTEYVEPPKESDITINSIDEFFLKTKTLEEKQSSSGEGAIAANPIANNKDGNNNAKANTTTSSNNDYVDFFSKLFDIDPLNENDSIKINEKEENSTTLVEDTNIGPTIDSENDENLANTEKLNTISIDKTKNNVDNNIGKEDILNAENTDLENTINESDTNVIAISDVIDKKIVNNKNEAKAIDKQEIPTDTIINEKDNKLNEQQSFTTSGDSLSKNIVIEGEIISDEISKNITISKNDDLNIDILESKNNKVHNPSIKTNFNTDDNNLSTIEYLENDDILEDDNIEEVINVIDGVRKKQRERILQASELENYDINATYDIEVEKINSFDDDISEINEIKFGFNHEINQQHNLEGSKKITSMSDIDSMISSTQQIINKMKNQSQSEIEDFEINDDTKTIELEKKVVMLQREIDLLKEKTDAYNKEAIATTMNKENGNQNSNVSKIENEFNEINDKLRDLALYISDYSIEKKTKKENTQDEQSVYENLIQKYLYNNQD